MTLEMATLVLVCFVLILVFLLFLYVTGNGMLVQRKLNLFQRLLVEVSGERLSQAALKVLAERPEPGDLVRVLPIPEDYSNPNIQVTSEMRKAEGKFFIMYSLHIGPSVGIYTSVDHKLPDAYPEEFIDVEEKHYVTNLNKLYPGPVKRSSPAGNSEGQDVSKEVFHSCLAESQGSEQNPKSEKKKIDRPGYWKMKSLDGSGGEQVYAVVAPIGKNSWITDTNLRLGGNGSWGEGVCVQAWTDAEILEYVKTRKLPTVVN